MGAAHPVSLRGSEVASSDRPMSLPSAMNLTEENVTAYLESLERKGRSGATVSCYAAKLSSLLEYLGGSPLRETTLSSWRRHLLERGYSPRTVNTYISAANGLVGYLGRRDLQLVGQLSFEGEGRVGLTRGEYLALLSYARACGRERDYLLAKSFASMGVSSSDLKRITVEAVECGELVLEGQCEPTEIPAFLASEILAFATSEGIEAGPVFRGRDGHPLSRTAVASCLRNLANEAGLPPERCGPGALSALRRSALDEIRESLSPLVRRTYESLLEAEQAAVGWDNSPQGYGRRAAEKKDRSAGLELVSRGHVATPSRRAAASRPGAVGSETLSGSTVGECLVG